jgi:Tfp pilus assembly protein PilX
MTPPTPNAGSSERGSAYLFVLLLLLVLTVIGLSLAVITQTEVQIGGAERTATRVLYGADSGMRLQLMLSRFAATRERRFQLASTTDAMPDGTPVAADFVADSQIDVSAFLPSFTGPCNLCTVNYGDSNYWLINYVTNAQGRRVTQVGGTEIVQGTKLVTGMYYISPEMDRKVDESVRVFDSETLADDASTEGLEVIRY